MIISSFLAKACSYSHASNGADLINNHISVPTKNTNLQKKEHTRKKPTKLSLTSETPHQNTNTPYFCIFKVSAETACFFSRVVGECRTFTMKPSCLSILKKKKKRQKGKQSVSAMSIPSSSHSSSNQDCSRALRAVSANGWKGTGLLSPEAGCGSACAAQLGEPCRSSAHV